MTRPPARHDDAPARRGMLLLLVLSILALFVVVGAVGILLAIRAREAARAFAAATADQAGSAALARAKLDEVLLTLIRGGTSATGVTESLLGDKYGLPQTCSVTNLSGAGSAYLTATVAGLDLSNPATVAGRVLTFVPRPEDPAGPTSYRILRTGTTANTLWLANVKSSTPMALPSAFPCEAVINGREFADAGQNEPYDAFGDSNPFLTQPVLQSSTVARVERPAFGAPGATCTVDNDGDGVADGIWLEGILPPQRTQDGTELSFAASYLVLDLDGRINLNAHGSFVRAQTVSSTSTYPRDPRTHVSSGGVLVSNSNCFPVGMGYGPVDVNAALLLSSAAEVTSGTMPAAWRLLLQGTANAPRTALVSSATQVRPTPRAETQQWGRYGTTTAASTNNGNPGGQVLTATNALNPDFWLSGTLGSGTSAQTGYLSRSPTDLKARLQVFTLGSPPELRFARPTPAWAATDTEDVLGTGAGSHPYRMRLDEDAPRGGSMQTIAALPPDAVFTPAELERILRQFDADAALLAPRLAALLDDRAEALRMTVTTDSWDTPAMTGAAAQAAAGLQGAAVYDVHSPEVVAGLRFNLNRPILTATGGAAPAARQDYFRHLYTLLRALGVTSTNAAQWAANVIEFRDPDSVMSWYPYDADLSDGTWNTGTTGVWGAERPEIVITAASASGNSATASLYRPWRATLSLGNATVVTGTTERIDPALGNAAANTLNAAALSGTHPVWRLVASGTLGLNTLTTATAVGTNTAVGSPTITGSAPATQVVLQRLADPRKLPGAALDTGGSGTNAYVDVHKITTLPTAARTVSRWLHWPNRDLVSHAELLAVPAADPATLPEICFDPARETSPARTQPLILDATIVPSRFVGAHVSVAGAALAGTGFDTFQHGQFSRWREAGRVNVNTILRNTGHPAERAHLDDAVWTAVFGRPGVPNPVTASGYEPIMSDRDLLVAGGDARFLRSDADAGSGFLQRSAAIRLANVATVRSHVFAVWITLKITAASDPDVPQYARLFAIVDRSIPVGYAPGRSLNTRETIRLLRYLP